MPKLLNEVSEELGTYNLVCLGCGWQVWGTLKGVQMRYLEHLQTCTKKGRQEGEKPKGEPCNGR